MWSSSGGLAMPRYLTSGSRCSRRTKAAGSTSRVVRKPTLHRKWSSCISWRPRLEGKGCPLFGNATPAWCTGHIGSSSWRRHGASFQSQHWSHSYAHATDPGHRPCPQTLPTDPDHRPWPQTLPTDPAHRPWPQTLPTDPGHRPCPQTLPTDPGHRPWPQTLATDPAHRPCPQTLPTDP